MHAEPKRARRACGVLSARDTAAALAATAERAPLVFAHTAPYASILVCLQSPLKAVRAYIATSAYRLGPLNLIQSRAGSPDGEEEFRILVETCSFVAPVHGELAFVIYLGMGMGKGFRYLGM